VRACISEFGAALGFGEQEIYDMNLAVNEVCVNIMEHDYRWEADKKIKIMLWGEPREVEIRVRDFAPPKDPSLFHSRNLDKLEGSGLGIFLVGELMDSIQYNQNLKEGNEIIMKKYHKAKMENEYGV
jgi:anti-sigma regulatory factor (Ser/Thr protein kinase)